MSIQKSQVKLKFKHGKALAAALALLVGCSTTPEIETKKMIVSGAEELLLTILVKKDETPIRNLSQDDFEFLYENDPVAINKFSRSVVVNTLADNIAFAIDFSGSMDAVVNGKSKLRIALQAVEDYLAIKPISTAICLVAFDDGVRKVIDFTNDIDQLKRGLNQAEAKRQPGGTKVRNGINYALKELAARAGTKALIVVSDGWDSDYDDVNNRKEIPLAMSERNKESLLEFARANHIRVFTVGIGSQTGSGSVSFNEKFLRYIADEPNGKYAHSQLAPEVTASMALGDNGNSPRDYGLLRIFRQFGEESAVAGEYSFILRIPGLKSAENSTAPQGRVAVIVSTPFTSTGKLLAGLIPLMLLLILPSVISFGFDRFAFSLQYLKKASANLKIPNDPDERPILERECPYSRGRFEPGDKIVVCPKCRTLHHLTSWVKNNYKCTTVGCKGFGRPLFN